MTNERARSVLEALGAVHRQWQQVLKHAGHGRDGAGPRNRKGHVQAPFDLAAHDFVVQEMRRILPRVEILSEEHDGPLRFGEGPPEYRVVVDPVDGSDNFRRGLPLSGLSVALIPGGAGLSPDAVECALVGRPEETDPYLARKGGGAWQGPVALHTSGVSRVADAMISCELNHFRPGPRLGGLLARARGVRSYGCASAAIILVASGRLDAHIDLRNRLTAESFLAASRVLLEAGGSLCTPEGVAPGPVDSLVEPVSLIAAATRELAVEISHEVARAATPFGS